MKLIKKDNKKGFTLIELVVVIAILAVLALILIPSITGYVKKADDAKNLANARSIYTAATVLNAESADNKLPTQDEVRTFADIESTVYFTVTEDTGNLVVKVFKTQVDADAAAGEPIATYPTN